MKTKYILITGGVVSGLGKGVAAASLGRLLKARGYRVSMFKFDPYLNAEPGGISPLERGEIFVTDDGAETDLDLGHFERIAGVNLCADSNITTGQVFRRVLNKEQRGEYGGQAVQIIPHLTDEMKKFLYQLGKAGGTDVVIAEIGGTVGDIENQPFLETIRQIAAEQGEADVLFLHVTLMPYISGSDELKSKPTQHSVKELLSLGIQPHLLLCRSEQAMPDALRQKTAQFCNIEADDVFTLPAGVTNYEMPVYLEDAGLAHAVCRHLSMPARTPDLTGWRDMLERAKQPARTAVVGIVGQYAQSPDAYLSVAEALLHAGFSQRTACDLRWLTLSELDGLKACDGIILTGGMEEDDLEGYCAAARACRTANLPLFAIGAGMHGIVLDIARGPANLKGAGYERFGAIEPVLHELEDARTGASPVTRRGLYPCKIAQRSLAASIYGEPLVYERHRNCREVNAAYQPALQAAGLVLSGTSADGRLTEIIEYPACGWLLGVQFAPQFRSRPDRPHPLFESFLSHVSKPID